MQQRTANGQNYDSPVRWRGITALLAAVLLFSIAPARAEGEGAILFSIPPQPLSSAVIEFSRQANVQVLTAGSRLEGVKTQGVTGRYSIDAGMRQLLAGTGFRYDLVGKDTISLIPPPNRKVKSEARKAPVEKSEDDQKAVQEPVVLNEIIVTAQKREQRLIDVPLAVTAITGAEIADRGVANLEDMQYAIPGLTIADTGTGLSRLQLNGIASQGGASGLPVVAVYIDEMPINAESYQPDVRLLDMERVEVLHGPQPTLYGDGAMGGTIRYVTASPNLSEFTGYADGQWGSVTDGSSSYRASAVLNAPLVDQKLGLRLAAAYEKDGGWIDSLLTGQSNVNDTGIETYRAKLLFKPVDALLMSLMVMREEHNQAYQNFGMLDRTTALNPSRNDSTDDFGNLILSYDLGPTTLLSSTGVMRDRYQIAIDATPLFISILPFFYPPNVVSTINSIALEQPYTDRQR